MYTDRASKHDENYLVSSINKLETSGDDYISGEPSTYFKKRLPNKDIVHGDPLWSPSEISEKYHLNCLSVARHLSLSPLVPKITQKGKKRYKLNEAVKHLRSIGVIK
jgi:hypothetical protein